MIQKLLYFILVSVFSFGYLNAQVLKVETFENGFDAAESSKVNVSDWKWVSTMPANEGGISTEFVRSGGNALKSTVRYSNMSSYPDGERCEYRWLGFEGNGTSSNFKKGEEYWFGISYYIPKDYKADSKAESIILQFHQVPDECDGDPRSGPPVRINLSKATSDSPYGNFEVMVRGESDSCADYKDNYYKKLWKLGKVSLGKWHDIVFHFSVGHNPDNIFQAWFNDKKIVDVDNARTSFNDAANPYVKVGWYHWYWNNNYSVPNVKTLYIDSIKIGDSRAIYKDVAPSSIDYSALLPSEGTTEESQETPLMPPSLSIAN